MKVSLSWLSEYLSIKMDVNDLADALTMAGLEIEVIEDRFDWLSTVYVSRVTEVLPHPNADRLKLCKVDTGTGVVNVVCGAPNVEKGMLAPLATPGTRFPDGKLLEKGVIRGEASEGMLCSKTELGIGDDHTGILKLDENLTIGDTLQHALNLSDVTFEIGLTPNRPDCLSLKGVAREIAAIQGSELKDVTFDLPPSEEDIKTYTSVEIKDPDHCPRYAARLLDNITVRPSPFWLQDRLMSVGLRPINNLVDITNFVMLETGQPLHAFDFDRLGGNRIVVRLAGEGEPFTTLDGKKRKLASHMLMICDADAPVAVGGVMGGLNSEIEASTNRVLIESAYFDPSSIRKTSKKLGLSTDASHRFERGIDPDATVRALDRAAALMAELGDGRLIKGVIDEDFRKQKEKIIPLSVKKTNQLLGTRIDRDKMAELLKSIEFQVTQKDDDTLTVEIPSFRVDVTRPVDLAEEVARLSGYNHIPTTFPVIQPEKEPYSKLQTQRNIIKEVLTGFGFSETINYSFVNRRSAERLGLSAKNPKSRQVEILNPLTEDQAVMRTSLVPGMLETMQRNCSRQSKNLMFFESGKTFIDQGKDRLPEEKEMVIGLWTGAKSASAWYAKDTACDYYDIKGVVEGLLSALTIEDIDFTQMPDNDCTYMRPGHTASILSNGAPLGLVGEIHPALIEDYSLRQTAFVFELDLEAVVARVPDIKVAVPLPRYPSTARDVTMIVDNATESQKLLDFVKNTGEELLDDICLFDIFEGRPVPEGKKSVSFRITYRSPDTTLEDDTVNRLHKNLTDRLLSAFGAMLPA